MINFIYHPALEKEIAAYERRFRSIEAAFHAFEKLCEVQFNPTNPQSVIAPGKLHCTSRNEVWTSWKVELAVKGLRASQFPRVWFAVKGDTILFTCMSSHIDNYKDSQMSELANARITEYF